MRNTQKINVHICYHVGGVLNTIVHVVNLKRKKIRAMEDRYLFKAKRLDNGEWVKGALVYDDRDKLYRIITELTILQELA